MGPTSTSGAWPSRKVIEETSADAPPYWAQFGFFVPDYAYFARADVWGERQATRPDDLTGRSLASGKLLMADTVFRYNDLSYTFNHGVEGYSCWDKAMGGPVVNNHPELITGTNQLLGDGVVFWKNDFKPAEMLTMSEDIGWVSSNGSVDRDKTGNINFW